MTNELFFHLLDGAAHAHGASHAVFPVEPRCVCVLSNPAWRLARQLVRLCFEKAKIGCPDHVRLAKDRRTLHRVHQLAHIARPALMSQEVERLGGKCLRAQSVPFRELAQSKVRQRRNVL